MENSNFLLLDTDFILTWENFLYNHNQVNKLLALAKNSTPHDKVLLYAEAVEAHVSAMEAYTRMSQLILNCMETAKPYLEALLHKD